MDIDGVSPPGALPSRPQSPARQAGVLQSSNGMLAEFMGSGPGASEAAMQQAAGMRAAKKHSPQHHHHHQQAQQHGQGFSLPAVNGNNPLWRDAARDAAATAGQSAAAGAGLYGSAGGGWGSSNVSGPGSLYQQQQQQQHMGSSKPPAGGSKWGSQAGCTAAGLSGLGSSLPASKVRNSWEDASGRSMQCAASGYGAAGSPGNLVSTRSSLASSLSNLDDALAGLHNGPGAGMLGGPMMPGSFGGYHVKGPSAMGAPGAAAAATAAAAGMMMGSGGMGAYGGVAGRFGVGAGMNIGVGSTHAERSNSSVMPGSLGAVNGMLGAPYGYGQQQHQQHSQQQHYYH
jgi:hypothetical protein